MKHNSKIGALILALALFVSVFVGCGGNSGTASGSADSGSQAAADTVKGETVTWGNITALVPEGMTYTGGSVIDKKDPDVLNIAKKDNATNYFLITVNDDLDEAKDGVTATKEANDGAKDTTFEAGAKWTGVTYDFSGMAVNHVYAQVGDKVVVIQSYGFAPDDDTTKAVLGSIKVSD